MAFTTNVSFPAVSALLGTGVSTVYTAPANPLQSSKPQKMTVVNTTGSIRTVDVYLVRSGDTAAARNQIVVARSVPANGSIDISELVNQTMLPGDFIQAKADAGTALAVFGASTEYYLS